MYNEIMYRNFIDWNMKIIRKLVNTDIMIMKKYNTL